MELLNRLRRHATDTPDRLALREVASDKRLTWAQLANAVNCFADELRRSFPGGGTVILRCTNGCNYHVAFLGALTAGMTVFPISPDIAEPEFAAAAKASGAEIMVGSDLSIQQINSAGKIDHSGPAFLLQSSGTTGLPKIVRRDATSLDADSSNMVAAIGITHADQMLSCVPLCHSYGLEHGLLAPIFAGAAVHLAQGFDLGVIQRELLESNITLFPAVPSIYEMLGNLPDQIKLFPKLRLAYSAGGLLPASVYEKVQRHYGLRIGQLYGATEIGSVTFSHPDNAVFDPASVGRAMDGVELRVDAEGQLLVRATSMMSGYVGETSLLTPDGFFPTGDLARLDANGNLFLAGRLKLLIDIGGLKVNPLEVEQTICQHPAVAACVVVPMRLSETVFRLKAIITVTDSLHPPGAEEIRGFVKERLSAHKVPRVIELRDSLPRSATGKVLRHLLVETT